MNALPDLHLDQQAKWARKAQARRWVEAGRAAHGKTPHMVRVGDGWAYR